MEFTANQVKVYQNSCLILSQELELNNLVKKYNELSELIELFSLKENNTKIKLLKNKQKEIDKTYKPLIKESKRIYSNTLKRINYNSSKC